MPNFIPQVVVCIAVFAGCAGAQDLSCQSFECPDGRTVTTDMSRLCPDKNETSGDCALTTTNVETCCPEGVKQTSLLNIEDDWRPVISANVCGALPLGIVIAVAIWSLKSINSKEDEELKNLEHNVLLFEEMEQESIRRSYRSSMFMNSTRRKSMRMRCSAPMSSITGFGRPLLLSIHKTGGSDLGFAIESMVVVTVEPDSPADRAGVTRGMQVKKVNDIPVTSSSIAETIKNAPEHFTLTVLIKEGAAREGTDYLSTVRSNGSMTNAGSTMASFRNSRLVRIRLEKGEGSVLGMQLTGLDVTSLKPGGIAESAGVKIGMQVSTVNSQKATITNVTKLVANAPPSFLVDFVQEFHFADEDVTYGSMEPLRE
eukprot:TRINITY_DN1106_c1_g3_i1.p1 TRINITY_DN1106_c1_g3~~TRINITY_DN1106_c1_g3_i1.p1  ORF type:complete len:388 (+),score=79.50 TRINITY_DN1106_c1_g3_i1:52-1164(+)